MKNLLLGAVLALASPVAMAQSPVVDGETIATPELVKAACAEGSVVYYTAQSDEDEREIAKPFMAHFPCVKVSVISAVTGRLFERMQTEAQAGKVVADAAMITDEGLALRLKDAKVIRPWAPPMAGEYPSFAKEDGWFYGASGTFLLMSYNNEQVDAKDAPKSWKDALDPRWKDKISASPVTIGGSAYALYAFLYETFGRDYLVKLAAQQPKMFPSYNPVVTAAARGETLLALTASLNEYSVRVGQGAPVQPVYPAEGVPYTTYPLLLLANAPHPAAGELFANWYLSKEGQAALVKQRGAYSLRSGVSAAKGNPAKESLKIWSLGRVPADKHDAFVNEVSAIFGAR
jgi:iron(III) transport system substrate-binding protein